MVGFHLGSVGTAAGLVMEINYFEDRRRIWKLFRCFVLNRHEYEEEGRYAYEYRCLHCGRKRI